MTNKYVYAQFYFLDGKPRLVWKKVKRSQLEGDGWITMSVDEYESKYGKEQL